MQRIRARLDFLASAGKRRKSDSESGEIPDDDTNEFPDYATRFEYKGKVYYGAFASRYVNDMIENLEPGDYFETHHFRDGHAHVIIYDESRKSVGGAYFEVMYVDTQVIGVTDFQASAGRLSLIFLNEKIGKVGPIASVPSAAGFWQKMYDEGLISGLEVEGDVDEDGNMIDWIDKQWVRVYEDADGNRVEKPTNRRGMDTASKKQQVLDKWIVKEKMSGGTSEAR